MPATAPAAAPTTLGLPLRNHESPVHVSIAAAVAMKVTTNALVAMLGNSPPGSAATRALPALKPNQPNHRMAAPRTTNGILCGSIGSRPYPLRRAYKTAATRAATPALMCTTVPPAKSSAPKSPNQPPSPQTQCAIGAYTTSDHTPMNTRNVLNFARSANAPVISAGVIIANVIWKTMKSRCGIVSAYGPGSWPTSFSPKKSNGFPISPPHSLLPKANE